MMIARLFVTHVWCDEVSQEFRKLSACRDADTWLLLDSRMENLREVAAQHRLCHVFHLESLMKLPYRAISTKVLVGSGHLLLLDFFLSYPYYHSYWFVEYDVRYTGQWEEFFGLYGTSSPDLLTAHIRHFVDEPLWPWWPTFGHPNIKLPVRCWIRSLNVIYRASGRALQFLDRILRHGWHGHHEVLIPTLLHSAGFSLLDFGGQGDFVDPSMLNSVYTSSGSKSGYLSLLGTIRFRPGRLRAGTKKGMLYHPVKPPALLESVDERRAIYRRWQRESEDELRIAKRVTRDDHLSAAHWLGPFPAPSPSQRVRAYRR
jgi:hypothetical protein